MLTLLVSAVTNCCLCGFKWQMKLEFVDSQISDLHILYTVPGFVFFRHVVIYFFIHTKSPQCIIMVSALLFRIANQQDGVTAVMESVALAFIFARSNNNNNRITWQ